MKKHYLITIFFYLLIILLGCEEDEKDIETDFSADKTTVTINETIQFTDLSKNGPENWLWDFGDDSTSTVQNPKHSYRFRGSYTVTLTSTNDLNGDTETKENYIKVNAITSSFIDSRDNQTYNTVKIGTQWWMSENLNYHITSSSAYDNNEENASIYGRLYYYQDALNACPDGWHLPKKEEWEELVNSVGPEPGKVLKADSLWRKPYNHTNGTGFSALPGGEFVSFYRGIKEYAIFWTNTLNEYSYPLFISFYYSRSSYTFRYYSEADSQLYIRCVQD